MTNDDRIFIVDTHSRFAPATDPRFSYRGEDVVQTLDRVCRQGGYPKVIRVDNGSEFIFREGNPPSSASYKITMYSFLTLECICVRIGSNKMDGANTRNET